MATRIENSSPTDIGVRLLCKKNAACQKMYREFENRQNDILDGECTGWPITTRAEHQVAELIFETGESQ